MTTGPVGQHGRPVVTGDRERQKSAAPAGIDAALLERGGVRFAVSDAVARLTLDRPQVHNAQLPSTWEALRHIGSLVPNGTRVVVVDGAGASFSAGLDTSAFDPLGDGLLARIAAMSDADADEQIAEFQESFRWLATTDAVSIAAVQGHAIGAGFQLALACDLVVAAESARFRMAEVSLGLVPDLGGTARLSTTVGRQRALEITSVGRAVTGQEAAAMGIAVRCVPDDALADAVSTLTTELLRQPAPALRAVTHLIRAAGTDGADQQLGRERAAQIPLLRGLAARVPGETLRGGR